MSNNKTNFYFIILFIFLFCVVISNILVRNFFLDDANFTNTELLYQSFFTHFEGLKTQVNNYYQNYNCEVNHSLHERHRLRWIFLNVWNILFDFGNQIFDSKKILFNLYKVLISILLFTSFYLLIISYDYKKNLNQFFTTSILFIVFLLLISSSNVSEINFSIIEFFFLSAGLYSIFKKNFLFFLIICCLAPLNRESGFIIPLIYLIFYPKEIKKILIVLLIPSLIYLILNYSSIKCFLTPGFLLTTRPTHGTFFDFNLISLVKIIIQDYFLTIIIFILYWNKTVLQKKILIIFLIYSFAFLIGTPIQHSIIKILYIPLLILFINSKDLKLNRVN